MIDQNKDSKYSNRNFPKFKSALVLMVWDLNVAGLFDSTAQDF